MDDMAMTLGLWWAPVILVLIALAAAKRVTIRVGWLVSAVLAHLVYLIVQTRGGDVPPFNVITAGQAWDWGGAIAAILATLVMLVLAVKAGGKGLSAAGLTLRQRSGSLVPALVATLAIVAVALFGVPGLGEGGDARTGTLVYRATAPGIDAELFYRGLLLHLLYSAVKPMRRRADPARFGWAAILATLLWSMSQALFVNVGVPSFDPAAFGYAAVVGALLMFLRVRTGSLLLPVVAHNLAALAGQLF